MPFKIAASTFICFPTDDFGAALDGGHHQRREVGVVGEVHLGAARQEGPDALGAAAERRHVQRSSAQSVPFKTNQRLRDY